MSSVLPFNNIYVRTKFHFNPFSTFQDMARTGIHYEKLIVKEITVSKLGRIMVLVHCPSSHCHLSIDQVPLQSFCTFQDMAQTGNTYEGQITQ